MLNRRAHSTTSLMGRRAKLKSPRGQCMLILAARCASLKSAVCLSSAASCLRPWHVRKSLPVMVRDISPTCDPHPILLRDVFHEVSQALRSSRFASDSRMQRDSHHLSSFSVQAIESVFQMLLVSRTGGTYKAGKHVELAIVTCKMSAQSYLLSNSGNAYSHSCTAA
jgi:hypothetical protein